MSKLALSNANYIDALALVANMREADAAEVDKTTNIDYSLPIEKNRLRAVTMCMRASAECKAVHSVYGELIAIGGIIPDGNKAAAWLLTTNSADKYSVEFARLSKKLLPEIFSPFSLLYNYVDIGYIKAIRWLLWLGFKTENVYEMNPSRAQFVKMTLAKE